MAQYRKLSWTDADVKCPFYIKDSRQERSVRCEGYIENSETVTKFKTLKERDRHMGICCVAKFVECPMYRLIYGCKYAEGERE